MCVGVTQVVAALARPKVLNCIEIATTTGSHFFSVDGTEERDEWIESIRKSSVSCRVKIHPPHITRVILVCIFTKNL